MDIITALKLILTRSPNAGEYAMQAIRAAQIKSPMLANRYGHVLQIAFSDPEAHFTPTERADLVSCLEVDDVITSKSVTIAVRVTPDEREALQVAAEAAGQSLSDYVRAKIL